MTKLSHKFDAHISKNGHPNTLILNPSVQMMWLGNFVALVRIGRPIRPQARDPSGPTSIICMIQARVNKDCIMILGAQDSFFRFSYSGSLGIAGIIAFFEFSDARGQFRQPSQPGELLLKFCERP